MTEIDLDPPPTAPFSVEISPDSLPSEPFDVPISPDLPPGLPFDVPISPDGPPASTFDVPISPDLPPRPPSPVSISPDAPPGVPRAVEVSLDALPKPPTPVSISLDRPPSTPIPVNVRPDIPPRPPIAVQVVRDPPPGVPFPVRTTPDLPSLDVGGRAGTPPTIASIVQSVRKFDGALGNFLESLVEVNPVTSTGPGGGALDPTVLAGWLNDYTKTVGSAGVARFLGQQAVLYAMNPVVARIFDPTYFFKMLVPGSMGHAKTALDVELGVTMETVARVKDAALQAVVALNPLRPGGNGLSDRPDVYGPENTVRDGQDFTVDAMVDAAIPGLTDNPGGGEFLRRQDGLLRFDATAYFESRSSDGAQRVRAAAKVAAASGLINALQTKLAASNALDGVIRVSMDGEEDDGSVLSTTQDPSDVVDDDEARVPLSFTDLRRDPVKNAYRSVYFRPTDLGFSTAISPEYAEGSSFGRVDPIVGYQKTSRTVTLTFSVHAFAPEDLRTMYNKLVWLSSMCYPSFGDDSLIKSGPVVRLRIGDAVSTESGGVPGVIRQLGFDFADVLWELKRGMKVPRSFKVSVEFLVLHDGPVGILNGVFGAFRLPPGGTAPNKDTNLAGNPGDSRTNGIPSGVSFLPGRFSKFGEPRR